MTAEAGSSRLGSPRIPLAARALAFRSGLDPVGGVVAAVALCGVAAAPFATLKLNRIASGKGVALWGALPPPAAAAVGALLLAAAAAAVGRVRPRARLAVAAAALAVLAVALAAAPGHLVPPGTPRTRRLAPIPERGRDDSGSIRDEDATTRGRVSGRGW